MEVVKVRQRIIEEGKDQWKMKPANQTKKTKEQQKQQRKNHIESCTTHTHTHTHTHRATNAWLKQMGSRAPK